MRRVLLTLLLCLANRYIFAQQAAPSAASETAMQTDTVSQSDLPAVADLLKAVEKHEDRKDALLQQYTFHSHHVMDEFDSNEAAKKTTTVDLESIPINGVRVMKVVARDGKPLTPDEAKKEDEDFDNKVEKAKKNKAKYDEKREQAEREGKSNDGFLPASRILELGTFSNERRVMLNGRSTIVLEYAGNRDVKTKSSSEKIVEDLVGTIWIDEQDKVLARVEGHFLADFKLGFGLLVDIHKGLTFSGAWTKVNGEVWLPAGFDGQGKASVGWLVYRIHGRVHTVISDYRKYHASATIVGSNGPVDDNGNPIPPLPETQPGSTLPSPPKP